MDRSDVFQHIQIDIYSATPKYLQLANSIIQAVKEGHISRESPLPSINELSFEFEISRDTAEKGYKYLKEAGILGSVPGKGYFIKNIELQQQQKIFLLFNKLSTHKKIIYDSFAKKLGDQAAIDFYVYNNDYSLFKRIVNGRAPGYTHYVIIPHFLENAEKVPEVINTISEGRLILLDKLIPGIERPYGAVYENFEKDIYNALTEMLPQLQRYHTLKLIIPSYTYHPKEIVTGFQNFCQQYAFQYKLVPEIVNEPIAEGEVYINLMEDDLVVLIERILADSLEVGKDVGVISYNETPLKKIILDGITTISTDFRELGERAAQLVLENSTEQYEIPFRVTARASL